MFVERFTEVLREQQRERMERERDRIRLLTADPFDSEAQRRIAEEIRYSVLHFSTNQFLINQQHLGIAHS